MCPFIQSANYIRSDFDCFLKPRVFRLEPEVHTHWVATSHSPGAHFLWRVLLYSLGSIAQNRKDKDSRQHLLMSQHWWEVKPWCHELQYNGSFLCNWNTAPCWLLQRKQFAICAIVHADHLQTDFLINLFYCYLKPLIWLQYDRLRSHWKLFIF